MKIKDKYISDDYIKYIIFDYLSDKIVVTFREMIGYLSHYNIEFTNEQLYNFLYGKCNPYITIIGFKFLMCDINKIKKELRFLKLKILIENEF